jgi:dinuclear metal center YbgI/SA1388 family protein
MQQDELVSYLDATLRVAEIEDVSKNGLQVEGPDQIDKVAFAVDACQAAFDQAVAAGAQLLVVHHGLFWREPKKLVGPHFRRVKTLIEGGCGLYAAHLPLDMHPQLGNNAELARLLGLQDVRPFGRYHGVAIGTAGVLDPPLGIPELIGRVIQALSAPPIRVLSHGPQKATFVGCVSGDAPEIIGQAADAGLDTYVTGETSHEFFHGAAEHGLNVLYCGHYATETLGVKALSAHLAHELGLETIFLNVPSGM